MITKNRTQKRQNRVRAKIAKNIGIPRLSVFRSAKNIYVQVVDDKAGKTLLALSTKMLDKGNKSEKSFSMGLSLAEKLLKLNIKTVVFDRGGYRFIGRVKAVAEGAREAGLIF